MDWPVIGTVSATILVAGAFTFEVVVFMQPDPEPMRPLLRLPRLIEPDRMAQGESSLPRLANVIEPDRMAQGESTLPRRGRLTEPDRVPRSESPTPADPEPTAPPPGASMASAFAQLRPSGVVYSAPPPREFKTAKLTLAEPPPREQWRVVVTAGANYYNLGGHIDRAGIVDEFASSHLREAL